VGDELVSIAKINMDGSYNVPFKLIRPFTRRVAADRAKGPAMRTP